MKTAKKLSDNPSTGLLNYDVSLKEFISPSNECFAQEMKVPQNSSPKFPFTSMVGPSNHSFALQLPAGDRLYGHVRRYQPHHSVAKKRIDVGRRSLRAMFILTRASGGEKFYAAVLKSLEFISSSQVITENFPTESPQKVFLHYIHQEHSRLCAIYTQELIKPEKQSQQNRLISIPCLEFGYAQFSSVDSLSFSLPQTLLDGSSSSSKFQLLPLLRRLGVSHTLRLFSALLCERQIVLMSHSPSCLAACAQAAMSILSQGLLHWQNIYIPVLPPELLGFLAAPTPFLVGVTENHSNVIPNIQGLGEVLVVDLDNVNFKMYGGLDASAVPDLLSRSSSEIPVTMDKSQKFTSIADILKNDLVDILKKDRKFRNFEQTHVHEKLGTAAVKSKEFLIKGFGKLKQQTKKQFSNQSSKNSKDNEGTNSNLSEDNDDGNATSVVVESLHFSEENYMYGEGFENEECERSLRDAFTIFYMSFMGDMRWYLSGSPGEVPTFNKELFVKMRVKQGDQVGTPMHSLTCYFKETQAFEQFVNARLEELRLRKTVSGDAPVFLLASQYHRMHRIEFNSLNARQVVNKYSNTNTSYFQNFNMRKRAMALTSNSRNEAEAPLEIARVCQDCRETTTLLVDVMSVIWYRLRDSKGMQWKHSLYALHLLQKLLIDGPVTAVIEAADGLNKVRKMKRYRNDMRSGAVQQIRKIATNVYCLLVNRIQLFSQRRSSVFKRKEIELTSAKFVKAKGIIQYSHDDGFPYPMPFLTVHAQMNPAGSSLVDFAAPVLAKTPTNTYANELLAFDFAVPTGSDKQDDKSHSIKHVVSVGSISAQTSSSCNNGILQQTSRQNNEVLQQAVFNEGSTVEETSLNTDTPSPNGIIYSHNRASQDHNLQEIETAPQYSLSSSFSVQLSTSNLEQNQDQITIQQQTDLATSIQPDAPTSLQPQQKQKSQFLQFDPLLDK